LGWVAGVQFPAPADLESGWLAAGFPFDVVGLGLAAVTLWRDGDLKRFGR